ncbi:MAG TPA: hypothetical protein VFS00_18140, partial [Polyangiaceae bacterium]|nr:hypothetical protein [Polyangiaceae bacterium]
MGFLATKGLRMAPGGLLATKARLWPTSARVRRALTPLLAAWSEALVRGPAKALLAAGAAAWLRRAAEARLATGPETLLGRASGAEALLGRTAKALLAARAAWLGCAAKALLAAAETLRGRPTKALLAAAETWLGRPPKALLAARAEALRGRATRAKTLRGRAAEARLGRPLEALRARTGLALRRVSLAGLALGRLKRRAGRGPGAALGRARGVLHGRRPRGARAAPSEGNALIAH